MLIGASPNEYSTAAPNQQNNQSIARLPNWQGRLGAGTTGGGAGLYSMAAMNANQPQGNLPFMIKALLSKRGA